MSESPYRVTSGEVPPMLGRERLFSQLCRHLTKVPPDHVSVVGPHLFGKSVMLKHLASHFPHDHFVASMYWDFRYSPPRTDAEFRSQFAERLRIALKPVRPDLAGAVDPDDEAVSDLLVYVLEELHQDSVRLLAVLDGFDHLLSDIGITRNLWDELRALAQTGSLCLVTGSRARLLDLCKDEDSRTSNFWQIFHDPPFRVGIFEDHDWMGFLAPFGSIGIGTDSSAEKEIRNWTGGVPVLAAALAYRLITKHRKGETISKADVDSAADAMANEPLDNVRALWGDCSIEVQSLLTELSSGTAVVSQVPDRRKRELLFRGFAKETRDGLRSSCRLMAAYADQRRDEVAYLNRLFGDEGRFEANVRGLLELRLEAIRNRLDPTLAGYALKAIRELPEPDHAIVSMRSFSETALDLIWDAELGRDNSLPEAWEASGIEFDEQGQLPVSRGQQCGILRKATGSANTPRVTRFLTKPAFLLLDHLHAVGDFGQHRGGARISVPTAAAFCLSAIELCERLASDLPSR